MKSAGPGANQPTAKSLQVTNARLSTLLDQKLHIKHALPATSPCIRTATEARALLRLYQDGARPPAVFVPVSRRSEVKGVLGALIDPSATTLDAFVRTRERPVVFVDPEAESLFTPCQARDRLSVESDSHRPSAVSGLMSTGLRSSDGDPESGEPPRQEYGAAWDVALSRTGGIASVGEWFERLTRESGSQVFLAPAPLIRADLNSVARALRVAWQWVDAATTFDARGPHFTLHSEVFGSGALAVMARTNFLEALRCEYKSATPRRVAYLSLKVYPSGSDLVSGTSASHYRRNFSEFVWNVAHHVRALGGQLLVQNLGTWALGGLDSLADLVSYRGDGAPLTIDPRWRRAKSKGGRKKSATSKRRVVEPFDPWALCDGSLREYKAHWGANGLRAFATSPHVAPEPFWEWEFPRRFEFRTRMIIDALLEIGPEYRTALLGPIPIGEAVRSRIQRMRYQDALYDLCPSVY